MQAVFFVSVNSSGRTLLGSRLKSARPRFTRRKIAVAAAPAIFGVAAAFAVAAAPAGLSAGSAQAHHSAATAATTAAVRPSGHTTAQLLSATSTAAQQYTVQSGDTLSSIAQNFYGTGDDWTALYWANDSQIQNPNVIEIGQVLSIPAQPGTIPAPPSASTAAPAQSETSAPAASTQAAPAAQSTAQQSDGTVSTAGDSSFQACVIQRESGGNPQVMNSSGHYGLYQFSESTWVEYGGNPADFGNASAAEQNQVFDNAMAAGGENNWAPYDGC
jgi:LysM repeat protein